MTTFKGVMRSYGATVRRMEREDQRRVREATKRFREQQKTQDISDVRDAVINFQNYIDTLLSLHKYCSIKTDWVEIRSAEKPEKPVRKDINESKAKWNLVKYKPNLIDRIFNLSKGKIAKLDFLLNVAIDYDERNFKSELEQYYQDLSDYNILQEIAVGIANHSRESYIKALEFFNPFESLSDIGTELKITWEDNFLDIDIHINDLEVIPGYELSQTSTGKLSKKAMPKSRFYDLYQDHICSSVIRISREVFACVPSEQIRINAIANLLNSKNGHLERKPVLSVIISRLTIDALNLNSIDPSDCMVNFRHNMHFKRGAGFTEVDKVIFTV